MYTHLKDCDSGRARWKRCTGKLCGKGKERPRPLRMPLFPNLHEFTKPEVLKTLFFRVLMEASVHNHDWLNHWPLLATNLQSLSLSEGWSVGGTDASNPLTQPLFLRLPCLGAVVLVQCPTLWDPIDCSTQGSSVLRYLPEFAQIHVPGVVRLSNHLILCFPLLLLPSVFPWIRDFSSELALHIRWM